MAINIVGYSAALVGAEIKRLFCESKKNPAAFASAGSSNLS
jgi:hypothetical protein